MNRRWRLVKALLSIGFAEAVQYRIEIFIWMATYALPPIMMFVWIGLSEARPVPGYDPADFVRYFMLVFLVRQMTPAWVAWQLSPEIRLGDLSPRLLRPLNPYWLYVAQHWTAMLMRFPVVLAIAVGALWAGGALPGVAWDRVPLFLLAVLLAWIVYFNMNYAVGLLAFWTDQAIGVQNLLFTLHMVLGGAFAPLDLFPAAVRQVVSFTPFPYVINFPVQLLAGEMDGSAMLRGTLLQVFWAVSFITLQRLLWQRGLRRYAAVGA